MTIQEMHNEMLAAQTTMARSPMPLQAKQSLRPIMSKLTLLRIALLRMLGLACKTQSVHMLL